MYAKKNKISLNNMYGIYIIITFVIITVISNLCFYHDDENINNVKIDNKYLPPSNIISIIWIVIFGILAYIYTKINTPTLYYVPAQTVCES